MNAKPTAFKIPAAAYLLVPALLLVALVLLIQNPLFTQAPQDLSWAISIDLLLLVPLVYWLVVRRTGIPNITVVPFTMACLFIGLAIVPPAQQGYLKLFEQYAAPVLELGLLSFVAYKVRKAARHFKQQQANGALTFDFFEALKEACGQIVPARAVHAVATEVAMFYYGFVLWKKPRLAPGQFSYHRQSGAVALLSTLIFLVVAETLVLHLLLHLWQPTVAWIMTILSVYSGLQVFGILRSLRHRPHEVAPYALRLRYGMAHEANIDYGQVAGIEPFTRELGQDEARKGGPMAGTKHFSVLGSLEPYNVLVTLKAPATFSGLYGLKKRYTRLLLHVDQPDNFVAAVQAMLLQK